MTKKSKAVVFIEGSNIYFAQKKMGKWLDWVKVKRRLKKNYDIIEIRILFSGDSDFEYLVKLLHKKGKKLFVYSSRKTLSWEVKLAADKYFLLENLRGLTKGRKFVRL